MSNNTLYLQSKTGDANINYTATQFRSLVAAQYPMPGVLSTSSDFNDLAVTPRAAGNNMSVDVLSGAAIVPCTSITNGGSYFTAESATVNVAIPAAPGSGKLVHRIVQRVYDPQNDASVSTYTSGPFCVAGTSTAGTLPTLPSNCLELAQVTVSAGTAAITAGMISDVRAVAAAPGQLLDTASSNTNTSSTNPAFEEVNVGVNVSARVSKASLLLVTYSMVVTATDEATYNIEGRLRRATGTTAPGTGGTLLRASWATTAGSTGTQMTISDSYIDSVSAGTYTYGLGLQGNGGRAWKNGENQPTVTAVYFVGLA